MAETQGGVFLRQVRKLVAAQTAGRLSDRQLLEQFLARQDESAFTALVQRHGPAVLSLCRSLLRHLQDAEDVFQATFLVLARKAGSIRKRESLGSWLYGVAHRLASKAKARAARHGVRELAAAEEAEAPAADDMTWRELRLVLHEELSRLPEKYRSPLLLCYWEGMTQEDAAVQLGWSKGTLKERVHRARELLRGRLTRRGVTLSAGLVTAMLCGRAGTAAEALALVNPTTRAALAFAAGKQAFAGGLSAAAALAEGVIRTMLLTKVKIAAAVLLTLGLLGAGAGVVGQQALSAGEGANGGKAAPAQAQADKERLQGTWVLQSGKSKGEDAPASFVGALKLVFAGDKVTVQFNANAKKEGTFTLNATAKPKEIDLVENGKPTLGIYRLQGDELTVCLDEGAAGRPPEFKSQAGTTHTLMVFRRENAAAPQAGVDRDDLKNEKDPAKLRQRIRELQRELQQTRDELKVTQAKLKELQALTEQSRREAEAQRAQAAEAQARAAEREQAAKRDALRLLAEEREKRLAAERKKADEEARVRAEQAGGRHEVANRLKQLALAMHNYHDAFGALPPAAIYSKDGKPLLSWRVALLPFIEQQELYKQFKLDEPWDSPHNKKLLKEMPKVFAPVTGKTKPNFTPFRVFTGKDTVFPGKDAVRLQDITDGTSNTLLIAEAAEGVPWTKPDELPYDAKKPLPKLGGMFKDGFYFAMCDGSVHFVRTPINEPEFRLLILPNDGGVVDLNKLSK
jgi:RNA polymerase sigma-70 factor (ECF subfamily)